MLRGVVDIFIGDVTAGGLVVVVFVVGVVGCCVVGIAKLCDDVISDAVICTEVRGGFL